MLRLKKNPLVSAKQAAIDSDASAEAFPPEQEIIPLPETLLFLSCSWGGSL